MCDQERNTSTVILAVLVALLILGTAIAFTFAGFEPLTPVKNAIAGFFSMPTAPQPQPPNSTAPTPPKTAPQPQPQPTPGPAPEKGSPGIAISEKPPSVNITDLEKQIHSLINLQRTQDGLASLALDDALSTVARKHSQDMAKRNYFNHISPEGATAVDRCRLGGISISKNAGGVVYYLGCAENIFQCTLVKTYYYSKNGVLARADYYSLSEIAALAVQGWMNSKGHRDNILTKFWNTEGIGIAISDNGDVYITQDFN